jgi:hypothetical protein
LTFKGLHGVTSQKIELVITTAARTSNPTNPNKSRKAIVTKHLLASHRREYECAKEMFIYTYFTTESMDNAQQIYVAATLGGILSLFLGFSVIGGIEFIYFFTIRLSCWMMRSRSDAEKTNSLMATSVTSVTGQYFSPQVSTTTLNLVFRRRSRTREPPERYRRFHEHHECVYDM